MAISLTKDEFIKRWGERGKILAVAVDKDINDIFPLQTQTITDEHGKAHIDLSKPIAELLRKEIKRVVDLVYLEALD